jgi:hypothetical protein
VPLVFFSLVRKARFFLHFSLVHLINVLYAEEATDRQCPEESQREHERVRERERERVRA